MKRIIYTVILIGTISLFSACGNSSTSSVEISNDMQDFITMIHGSSDDVTAALAKYGANDDIVNNDMSLYNLDDPVVTAKNGDCYTVEFSAGMTTRVYDICWEDNKITNITDKGMKME